MLKAIFKWNNDDSTRDLNLRFGTLLNKGIMQGGELAPGVGLSVVIAPFMAYNGEGLLVQEDTVQSVTVLAGQTNIITLYALYNVGSDATMEYRVYEASAYASLTALDQGRHIVLGTANVAALQISVNSSDISYALTDYLDRLGRSSFRGRVLIPGELPLSNNRPGDFFIQNQGIADLPEIYAWDGLSWRNITNTLALSNALTNHRANLYPDEKHLTDLEKEAAAGSYGAPSILNRYVTETDPRLPSSDENDALIGSHGTPSSLNRYVTEFYPLAVPTTRSFPTAPPGPISLASADGPFYVGKGPLGSANQFFSILDGVRNRGFLRLGGLGEACPVVGVYKDVLLSIPLLPDTDPSVDYEGFYTGDVYLQTAYSVDSGFRVLYGQRDVMQEVPRSFTLMPTPGNELVSADAAEKIKNIKGRPYDVLIPQREQNVQIRKDIDSVQSYLGSVLETNVVAAKEDFERLDNVAVIGGNFDFNIGVDFLYTFRNSNSIGFSYAAGVVQYSDAVSLTAVNVGDFFYDAVEAVFRVVATPGTDFSLNNAVRIQLLTGGIPGSISISVGGENPKFGSIQARALPYSVFDNIGAVGFTYNATTGVIQYTSSVNLSAVSIGDTFLDAAGAKFRIIGVNDGSDQVTIRVPSTLAIPRVSQVVTSAGGGSSVAGTIRKTYNPRDYLLSEMKMIGHAETIPVTNIVTKANTFSQPDGRVVYTVLRTDNRYEDRLELVGPWENYVDSATGERYVRNASGGASISFAFFGTGISLLMRRRPTTGTLSVYVNERGPTTVSTSAAGFTVPLVSMGGPRFSKVPVVSSLPASEPSYVRIEFNSGGPYDIFGIEIERLDNDHLIEPGRGFTNAQLLYRDSITDSVMLNPQVDYGRGGRTIVDAQVDAYNLYFNDLMTFETATAPLVSTAGGTTGTVFDPNNVMQNLKAGDLIQFRTGSSVYHNLVTSVSPFIWVYSIPSGTYNLIHVASTDVSPIVGSEEVLANYNMLEDLVNYTAYDFRAQNAGTADRYVVAPDRQNLVYGKDLSITDLGITGVSKAVKLPSSGELNFLVLGTRLDLIANNTIADTLTVTIDYGVSRTISLLGGSPQRITIFSNARYQTHRISITSASGNAAFSEMYIHGPSKPAIPGDSVVLADFSQVADYVTSSGGNPLPFGGVYHDPLTHFTYVDNAGVGTAWDFIMDRTKSEIGGYITTTKLNAYTEFQFVGTGFEIPYLMGPDHGNIKVTLNGLAPSALGTLFNMGGTGIINSYSASYSTGIAGIYNLPLDRYTIRISNNESGKKTGVVGAYVINSDGNLKFGINQYGVYSQTVDSREFLATDAVVKTLAETVENGYTQSSLATTSLLDNTTNGVAFLQPEGTSRSMIIGFSLSRGTDSETGILLITSNGTAASVTPVAVGLAGLGVSFTADVTGGNLRLLYTTTSTGSNATFKYFFFKWGE